MSTSIGAFTNIVLNIIFIPVIGPLGAAIATAISYFEVYVVRLIQSRKYIKLQINLVRDAISYVLILAQAIVLLVFDQTFLVNRVVCIIFLLICFLYVKDIKMCIIKVVNR